LVFIALSTSNDGGDQPTTTSSNTNAVKPPVPVKSQRLSMMKPSTPTPTPPSPSLPSKSTSQKAIPPAVAPTPAAAAAAAPPSRVAPTLNKSTAAPTTTPAAAAAAAAKSNENTPVAAAAATTSTKAPPPTLSSKISGNPKGWPKELPSFADFCTQLTHIYDDVKKNQTGAPSEWIPQTKPDSFSIAICTGNVCDKEEAAEICNDFCLSIFSYDNVHTHTHTNS
jgi:hypothetical protein